jgi:hypothetical protein
VKAFLLLGAAGAAAAVPAVVVGALLVASPNATGAPAAGVTGSAAAVLADPYPDLYRGAAPLCPGLDWHVLEAVGQVESQHGANDGPSTAGAIGPMQFKPDTWTVYGDGNPDDVWAPPLAIPAAARMICANAGGKGDDVEALRKSLSIYNAGKPDSPDGLAYAAHVLAVAVGLDVLSNPRIDLAPAARADVTAGIDPRADSFLEAAAAEWPIAVGTVRTGHSVFVEGTDRVSEHTCGRAVDLVAVGSAPVSPSNPAARALVTWTATLTGTLRPDEVGSPWPEFSALPGDYFSDAGHDTHVHVGYRGPACLP